MKLLTLFGAAALIAGTAVSAVPAEAQRYHARFGHDGYRHYPRYGYRHGYRYGYRHHPHYRYGYRHHGRYGYRYRR